MIDGPGNVRGVAEPDEPERTTERALEVTHEQVPGDPEEAISGAIGRFVTLGALGRGGMGMVLSAFDPELDRRVAIKVLHSETRPNDEARAQLQREAKAMAKLAHPNVVTVYEVGYLGEQLFIAMELVEGVTLRTWLSQPGRSWREIVAMFVAAGRGLVAAHEVGLVHRDFKPENVLIGNDGRPRVSDFGLATRQLDHELGAVATTPIDRSFSYQGVPVGTPAYMSPEQWSGGNVDARTDQFAFSVALWSALYGVRPFPGDTSESLRNTVLAGRRTPPPRRTRTPRWLVAILMRGLETDPERRWPTLRAQLDELHRRAATRRRTSVALAGALVVASTLAVVAWTRTGAAEPCGPPDDRIGPVWGTARRAAIEQHAVAADPTYGAQRFAAVAGVLDSQLAAWRQMHIATCRATRVDGTQSDHMLDLRMRCLADWLEAADEVASGLLAAKTSAEVENATRGVRAIPALSRCADDKLLEAVVEPPSAPADRVEFDAIASEAKTMNIARKAGKLEGLVARADALIARARKLGHPAGLTKALAIRWRLAIPSQDIAGAVRFLREEVEAAARAHDDEEAAKSWSWLIQLVGLYQGHPVEARAMFPAARAAAARAGDPVDVLVSILDNESTVLVESGDHDAAFAVLAEQHDVLERAGAMRPGSPLLADLANSFQGTGDLQHATGQLDAAVASMREAIVLYARARGPDTIEAAAIQLDLAQVLRDKGEFADAEEAVRTSVRIRERGGQTASLAMALSVQSQIAVDRGHVVEGVELGERAVKLARATMPADDATLQTLISNLADTYDHAGRSKLALAMYDGVLKIQRRTKAENVSMVLSLLGRGDVARRLGQCGSAITSFHEAAQLALQLEGKNSQYIGSALRGEGLCLHQLGHDADALAVLERSVGYPTPGTVDNAAQIARGVLGMLLVESGRDRKRGLQLARAALARLHELRSRDPLVPALERWLAKIH